VQQPDLLLPLLLLLLPRRRRQEQRPEQPGSVGGITIMLRDPAHPGMARGSWRCCTDAQ
jgi:hypothetical protein